MAIPYYGGLTRAYIMLWISHIKGVPYSGFRSMGFLMRDARLGLP